MKTKRKLLSILITLAMVVSLIPVMTVPTAAITDKLDAPAIQLNDKTVIWRPVENAQRYEITLLYRLEGAGEAVSVRVSTDTDYNGTVTKASAYSGNSSYSTDVKERIQYIASLNEYILNLNDFVSYYYSADYRCEIRAAADGYDSSDTVSTNKISGKDLANGYSTPFTLSGKVNLNSDSGKFIIGSKVNAVHTGSAFDEILSNELQYAWMYRDGASGTANVIPGASGDSYTIDNQYDNKQISVAVSSTKRGGIIYSNWITVGETSSTESYTVTVINDGNGTGAASPTSGSDGTIVTLTATPNSGYKFKEWVRTAGKLSGGLEVPNATSATTSFTISGYNVEVKATFEKISLPTHTVIPNALNVRESPDSGSARIGGVTSGKEVTVVETQGEWSKIIYGTGYGWVQSKYLTSLEAYGINVTNGYANVSQAREGETVTISYTGPSSILKQKMTEFDHWKVTSGNATLADPNSKVTTFVMPAGNVFIEGVYKNKEETKSNPFVDIYESDNYYDAVLWAYYASPQVTNGMDETHFGPQLTVTRAQAVTFLWRSQGCPEPSSTVNPFVDVPSTEYYYKPVLWAVEKGITKGVDDTHFNPMDTLSTLHMITFLYRTKNPGMDGWNGEAAAWAADENGKPFGVEIAVDNDTDCPRCNVVQFLYKLSK